VAPATARAATTRRTAAASHCHLAPGMATPIAPPMIVEPALWVVGTNAPLTVSAPAPTAVLRASSVPDNPLVAPRTIVGGSGSSTTTLPPSLDRLPLGAARRPAPAMSLATVAPQRGSRRFPRSPPLLPLALGRRDFLRRPGTIEKVLKLIQRRRANRPTLSSVHREA
jgi:hypothetical protein